MGYSSRNNKNNKNKTQKVKGGSNKLSNDFKTEFDKITDASESSSERRRLALIWVEKYKPVIKQMISNSKGSNYHADVKIAPPVNEKTYHEQHHMSEAMGEESRQRRENDQTKIIELNQLFREIVAKGSCDKGGVTTGDTARKNRNTFGFYKASTYRGSYFVLPLKYVRDKNSIEEQYPSLGEPPSSKFSVGSIYTSKREKSSTLVTVPSIGATNKFVPEFISGIKREIKNKDNTYSTSFLPEDLVYVLSSNSDEEDDDPLRHTIGEKKFEYYAAVVIGIVKKKNGVEDCDDLSYRIRPLVKSWSRVGKEQIVCGSDLIWIGWSTKRDFGKGAKSTEKHYYKKKGIKETGKLGTLGAVGMGASTVLATGATIVGAPLPAAALVGAYLGFRGLRYLTKAAFGSKILRPKIPIMILHDFDKPELVPDGPDAEEKKKQIVDMNKLLSDRLKGLVPGKGLDDPYSNAIEVLSCNEKDRRTRYIFGPRRLGGKKTKKAKK